MSTRVAILSDTHSRPLPSACVEQLRRADVVLHAGDVADVATLDAIARQCGGPFHAVCGNVDDAAVRARLPPTLELDIAGARVAMVHDAGPAKGRLARLRRRFARADAVVFGHSHIPLLEAEGGVAIFNPGSPTDRRRQPAHTMGVAMVAGGAIDFTLLGVD